jgi:DNA repair ATPase RecN
MVYFKDIEAIDNGGRFLNVDLHVHSHGASTDVKDATMTPQAIVDSAVAQGLSVIAITDHNSNKNVDAALEHAQQYAGRLLVLPGVEVTTAHGHLLAYFAPERTEDLAKFLSRLDLIGAMGAENTRTAKSMADVIGEAERLGGICIAAHIDREKTGFHMFAPGFQNWKRDIITSVGLYGVECDAKENLCWYSEADEAGSAGAERRKLLEARSLVPTLKARHHLAHVQDSDSHSMAQFQNPSADKPWTRIKLTELSFGALRIALIDPTARVRASASVPRAIPRVRGISFTGGFLHGETIHFSDNLNCFIGGRGTGKSTAIRALAYSFGINEEFGEFENCPDSVVVFCEDADGVLYRYERAKGGDISVKAKEDRSITEVPIDAFHIEYFGQGELAQVAKDPLKTPQLFQEFLDRHINLRDLTETEESLVTQLRENAARLNPLEASFTQLTGKRQSLAEIEKKLKIAEEGKLRDVVGVQSKIASEKTIRASVETIIQEYNNGLTLANFERDYLQLATTAGECTEDENSKRALKSIQEALDTTNATLKLKAEEINAILKKCAKELTKHCAALKANHSRLEGDIASKVADLRAKGLAGNVAELQLLLRQKGAVGKEIATVEQRGNELKQCRGERAKLLAELTEVRAKMTERRKAQLKGINQNLALTLKDYLVFVRYDDAGITDEFFTFIANKMTGSYLQDQTILQVCSKVTPSDLAKWVLAREETKIASAAGISVEWSEEIINRLCYWTILFELEVLAKPPKPIITVRTKSTPPKEIPVLQLSDGQRHTILLTIAMLAESNVPLVIDQPEDDLDNAFIFSSIVTTLRAIKERRQVILVTHNANIAVLGDSELLLPMHRENDVGKVIERGSIDREATKLSVQKMLEGGPTAFLRRKEIYGY